MTNSFEKVLENKMNYKVQSGGWDSTAFCRKENPRSWSSKCAEFAPRSRRIPCTRSGKPTVRRWVGISSYDPWTKRTRSWNSCRRCRQPLRIVSSLCSRGRRWVVGQATERKNEEHGKAKRFNMESTVVVSACLCLCLFLSSLVRRERQDKEKTNDKDIFFALCLCLWVNLSIQSKIVLGQEVSSNWPWPPKPAVPSTI